MPISFRQGCWSWDLHSQSNVWRSSIFFNWKNFNFTFFIIGAQKIDPGETFSLSLSKLPLTCPEGHFAKICFCENVEFQISFRIMRFFSDFGLAFFSRFVNTTFYVFSRRCHGKLFFRKKCSFLDFFRFRANFFRTTCWGFSARLWKLHFRCPDEYVEDKNFFFRKQYFFSLFQQ